MVIRPRPNRLDIAGAASEPRRRPNDEGKGEQAEVGLSLLLDIEDVQREQGLYRGDDEVEDEAEKDRDLEQAHGADHADALRGLTRDLAQLLVAILPTRSTMRFGWRHRIMNTVRPEIAKVTPSTMMIVEAPR